MIIDTLQTLWNMFNKSMFATTKWQLIEKIIGETGEDEMCNCQQKHWLDEHKTGRVYRRRTWTRGNLHVMSSTRLPDILRTSAVSFQHSEVFNREQWISTIANTWVKIHVHFTCKFGGNDKRMSENIFTFSCTTTWVRHY